MLNDVRFTVNRFGVDNTEKSTAPEQNQAHGWSCNPEERQEKLSGQIAEFLKKGGKIKEYSSSCNKIEKCEQDFLVTAAKKWVTKFKKRKVYALRQESKRNTDIVMSVDDVREVTGASFSQVKKWIVTSGVGINIRDGFFWRSDVVKWIDEQYELSGYKHSKFM